MALKERLKEKGWQNPEIAKASYILSKAEQHKHPSTRFMDSIILWIIILVGIIVNTVVAVALLPFLVALNQAASFFFIIIAGLGFGLLFEAAIHGLEHLENRHHALIGLVVPIASAAIIFYIINYAQGILSMLSLALSKSAPIAAIVYVVAFIFPYLLYHFVIKK